MRTRERLAVIGRKDVFAQMFDPDDMSAPPGIDPQSELGKAYAEYPSSLAGRADRRRREAAEKKHSMQRLFFGDLVNDLDPSLRVEGSYVIVEPGRRASESFDGGYRDTPQSFGLTYKRIDIKTPPQPGDIVSFGLERRRPVVLSLFSALYYSGVDEGWAYAKTHKNTKRKGKRRYVSSENGREMFDDFLINGWAGGPREGLDEMKAQLVASNITVYDGAKDFEIAQQENASRESWWRPSTAREAAEVDYQMCLAPFLARDAINALETEGQDC